MKPNINKEIFKAILALESSLSYERIFNLCGLEKLLNNLKIELKDLNPQYVQIFFKIIKNFLTLPAYNHLDIMSEKDLKFLLEDEVFEKYLLSNIVKIKKGLKSREHMVLSLIEKLSVSEYLIKDIVTQLHFDAMSLFLILSQLKENKQIKDYTREKVFIK